MAPISGSGSNPNVNQPPPAPTPSSVSPTSPPRQSGVGQGSSVQNRSQPDPNSNDTDTQDASQQGAREGTPTDLATIPRSVVQQAIQNAQATGSTVAQVVTPDGEVLLFPLSLLQSLGFPVGTSQTPSVGGYANAPSPSQIQNPSGTGGANPQAQPGYPSTGGTLRQGLYGGPTGGGGGYNPTATAGGGYAPSAGYGYGSPAGSSYAGSSYGYGNYGGMSQNQFMWDLMVGSGVRDQANVDRSNMRKAEQQLTQKMKIVLLQILMGDITGAIRTIINESEKQNRMFNRIILNQLEKVRQTKSKILLEMGRNKPPQAHDNTNDPAGQARDQNKQAKYTQWVSVTTQYLSEVQQTEREIMDVMSEARKNINDLWEAYSGIKEAEARTTRTVIQSFRG
jgi:hypothetical protein